jgi:exosortase
VTTAPAGSSTQSSRSTTGAAATAPAAAIPALAKPESPILGVFTTAGLVMTVTLGLAFVALFYRWMNTQRLHSLEKPEDWGHAFVIPLISAFLIWREREKLAKVPKRVFWPAFAPFILGIAAYFFCVVGIRNHMLQGFSIILTLYSLLLFMLGTGAARLLFLPIAYLAFGITIAEIIMIKITFPLQLIAAEGAGIMLKLCGAFGGFEVEVKGNILTVITGDGKEYPLNVAEQCSGMRMVIAFYALAGAVALLSCKFWWQRVAVILLAAPVAVFMNVIRVGVLGLATLVDPNFSQGDAHMLIGTLLLIPGLGLFMLCVWALERVIISETEPAAKASGAKPGVAATPVGAVASGSINSVSKGASTTGGKP